MPAQQPEEGAVAADPAQDEVADNNYASAPPPANYRANYTTPYGYNPYYSGWYPYAPPQMRQVEGPDGRWYLVPSYSR